MCEEIKVSRRGVYYDLTKSPYEFTTPYGDIFKFKSQKRLDMYKRDIGKEIERVEKAVWRNEMQNFIPDEIMQLIFKAVYRALYRKIEG